MAILELDQSSETPLTEYQRGPFQLRYAYARSKDCQDHNERGQDYLVWRAEPFRAAFALCDGVGQSFFGGLASQIVGETLIEWLWKFPLNGSEGNPAASNLSSELGKLLNSRRSVATQFVNEKELQSIDTEIVREVLEARKEKRGTESNFVCGFIDIPSDLLPNGRISLFWLGDAKIQLWLGEENKTALLNASWNKQEGWSSKLGIYGEIHSFHGNLEDFDCLIAHSDGVDSIQKHLSPRVASDKLDLALKTLGDDDVSLFEVRIDQVPPDIEDDLVSALRDTPNVPVRVINQTKTIQAAPEKITVERQKTPFRFKILSLAAILFAAIACYFTGSYHRFSRSTPLLMTNTPMVLSLPPAPTHTPMPVEPTIIIPTATLPPDGVSLFLDALPPFAFAPGCKNLANSLTADQSKAHFEVRGSYILTGYSEYDCHGSVVIRISDGATQPLVRNILSVGVEEVTKPVP